MRLRKILFTFFNIIVIFVALAVCSVAEVSLEEIPIDDSTTILHCDYSGCPEVLFSKDYHPLVEFENHGLFPARFTGVFYFRNIGTEGQVEITTGYGDNNKLTKEFVFRAGQDYMVKVDVGVGPSASSWRFSTTRVPWFVPISVGGIRSSVLFDLPICHQIEARDIRIQEMIGDEIVAVSDGAPDASWFADSVWQEKYKYCDNVHKFLRFRNDGIIEYNRSSPENLQPDERKDTWEVINGNLLINWNDGYAIVTFPLDGKRAERYFGTHSRSPIPTMIEKVE